MRRELRCVQGAVRGLCAADNAPGVGPAPRGLEARSSSSAAPEEACRQAHSEGCRVTHPASFMRWARHGISELPVDFYGIPDGPDYDTFLTVNEMRAKRSVRTPHPGVWSGRGHHLASLIELHVKLGLEA